MITSLTTLVSNLKPGSKIPSGAVAYVKARLKQEVYDVVVSQFKESGLSQVDLARRLGKDATSMSRLFAGPANVTIETLAETVFATTGSFVRVSIFSPKVNQGRIVEARSQILATPPAESGTQMILLSATERNDTNSQVMSI